MEKNKGMIWYEELSEEARNLTLPEVGLKLTATIDPRGWPHITMISFNNAKTTKEIVWGQFTEGTIELPLPECSGFLLHR